ncbi:MAG: ankyrin repeat domain-containing protein [Zoogloeaceae bacterium]|nr:ankyrin repeat domain-containing protein [Zoogloeaceae bacterium]
MTLLVFQAFQASFAVGEETGANRDFILPEPIRFGVAMEVGDLAQAKAWLEQGLPPDYLADRIGSGLMIAAWEGNLPMMELFHRYGADVNLENGAGEQALLLAAWKGRREVVEWLLARGAELNRPAGKWSALHYAAFAGQKDLADYLLARGADIDARSPNGSTPLMMAIYDGHPDIARKLIEQGANKDLRNQWGDGAMEWAMRFNQTAVARMIGSPEEFIAAASQPKENWGSDTRSEPVPPELDKLLRDRRYLIARGISPDTIDRNIAALRARYARQSVERSAPPRVTTLEITADPDDPGKQKAKIVHEPQAPTRDASTYRLPRQKPGKTPARKP